MGKPPAFQMYAADFQMDTDSMTLEEIGAYTKLLMSAWVNGSIPSDHNKIRRILGIGPKKFTKVWFSLASKWTISGESKLVNPRMEIVREEQRKYSEKQRERANKRWNKDDATACATAIPRDMPKRCSSSSTSSSIKKYNNNNGRSEYFDEFWNLYGKKINSKKCKDYYLKNITTEEKHRKVLEGVKRWMDSGQWNDKQFQPYPYTFLFNERWNDEPEKRMTQTEKEHQEALDKFLNN